MSGNPSKALSVCGLDIGSNTFSCCEVSMADQGVEIARDASMVVRLAEDLVPGGSLKPAAVARGLVALRRLATRFGLRDKPLRAVGTAVLRMAGDPEVFIGPAQEILGASIEILSGEQEALMVCHGAILGLNRSGPWIVVDVGGRSIEVVWLRNGVWNPISLPTGVLDLTKRFLITDPPLAAEVRNLRNHLRSVIERAVSRDIEGYLLGVAGTATTLGGIDLGLSRWRPDRVHGFVIPRDRLEHWIDTMLAIPASERSHRYGVGPGRSDVFPAGLCVLAEIMAHLDRDALTISVNGLRVGAALQLLERK